MENWTQPPRFRYGDKATPAYPAELLSRRNLIGAGRVLHSGAQWAPVEDITCEGATMKRLFFISFLIVTMSPMVFAQNSATPQTPGPARSGDGKGGGPEVFVTGFGLLPGRSDGNAISEQATKAGGGAVGYRFHLNASSSLEG